MSIYSCTYKQKLGWATIIVDSRGTHTHGLPAGFEGSVVTGGRCGLNTPVGGYKSHKLV